MTIRVLRMTDLLPCFRDFSVFYGFIINPEPGIMSPANHNRCLPQDDHTAVRRRITNPGGGFATDQHGGRALYDSVRRPDTDAHIADCGGRKPADKDGGRAGAGYRPTHVRHKSGEQWAGMHISEASGWRHLSWL